MFLTVASDQFCVGRWGSTYLKSASLVFFVGEGLPFADPCHLMDLLVVRGLSANGRGGCKIVAITARVNGFFHPPMCVCSKCSVFCG